MLVENEDVMRIIIINSLYYPHKVGGAEVSVQMLAEDVARQGNDVLVLTLHDDKYIRKENINGVNVEYLPLRNVYWPFSGGVQHRINKLRWHIKDLYNREMIDVVESRINEFKPDVVHTNNLSGFSVGIWKLLSQLKIPLVHTTRDYYLFHPNSTLFKNGKNMSLNNILVRFNKYYKGVMSNHVDVMVGISDYIKNLHKDNAFGKKAYYTYIHNPINKISLTNKNILDPESVKVGFLGRLTSDKGFDEFIELSNKYKGIFVFIAAGNTDSSKGSKRLLEEAKQNGILVLGYVPVDEFLSKIDVLLLPTKWNEPFGRVVAEAALAGKPVYTNLNGGVSEIAKSFSWVKNISNFNKTSVLESLEETKSRCDISNPFERITISKKYIDIYKYAIENKRL